MKVFVKAEKRLACDLRPGDIFVLDLPDKDYFPRTLNGDDVAIVVMLRTNVPDDEIDDREKVVYKLDITTVKAGETAPTKINPHSPPGMKDV